MRSNKKQQNYFIRLISGSAGLIQALIQFLKISIQQTLTQVMNEDIFNLLIIALAYLFAPPYIALIMLILYWPEKNLIKFEVFAFDSDESLSQKHQLHIAYFIANTLAIMNAHIPALFRWTIYKISMDFTNRLIDEVGISSDSTVGATLSVMASLALAIFLPLPALGINSKVMLAIIQASAYIFQTYYPSKYMIRKRIEKFEKRLANVFTGGEEHPVIKDFVSLNDPGPIKHINDYLLFKGKDQREQHKAYLKTSLQLHPDKHATASDELKEQFNKAFKILGNAKNFTPEQKRVMYLRGMLVPRS